MSEWRNYKTILTISNYYFFLFSCFESVHVFSLFSSNFQCFAFSAPSFSFSIVFFVLYSFLSLFLSLLCSYLSMFSFFSLHKLKLHPARPMCTADTRECMVPHYRKIQPHSQLCYCECVLCCISLECN